eukprot:scaffold3238_cov240-Pinguiococcus_pyrenoidosus.AAC.7
MGVLRPLTFPHAPFHQGDAVTHGTLRLVASSLRAQAVQDHRVTQNAAPRRIGTPGAQKGLFRQQRDLKPACGADIHAGAQLVLQVRREGDPELVHCQVDGDLVVMFLPNEAGYTIHEVSCAVLGRVEEGEAHASGRAPLRPKITRKAPSLGNEVHVGVRVREKHADICIHEVPDDVNPRLPQASQGRRATLVQRETRRSPDLPQLSLGELVQADHAEAHGQ